MACGDETQSLGLGRAEEFIMVGQGILTVWNSLRQDDFTAKQRCGGAER